MGEFIPSTPARQSLAIRFGLAYHEGMQDWEYEVADTSRFSEWLEVYRCARLSDAERASLMEMLVQCVDDLLLAHSDQPPEQLAEWQNLAGVLRHHASLHAATIDYWSCLGESDPAQCFAVTAPMRALRAVLRQTAI